MPSPAARIAAILLPVGLIAGSPPPPDPTFARDVAPILYRHCAACHRPSGSAPFALLAYEDAAPRAALIAAAMVSRRMPPWLPERGDVPFAGERRVPVTEIDVVRRWAAEGAPRGDLTRLPPPPRPSDGWRLGEPDLVVEFPAYVMSPGGADRYRNLVVPAPLGERRWVTAVELLPGDPRVVHHARLMVDTTGSSRTADARDPGPGFDGMELASDATSPQGFFVGWTPGKLPARYPAGLAWPLAPGTDLVLQLHLPHAEGTVEVRPRLGLHLSDRPPTRPAALIMLGTKTIDIPAGDSAYVVTDAYRLPVAAQVLGVYPHAHYLAMRMEAWATLPDGAERRLLVIPRWDFNWQDEYRYATPIALPAGTVLAMRYTFDNSAGNPHNPSRPARRVTYGPQSTDEMADLVVQVVLRRAEDVATLERDLSWKYYAEQVASDAYRAYVAGQELVAAGRLEDAVAKFRESLSLRSDDARVLRALRGALDALERRP